MTRDPASARCQCAAAWDDIYGVPGGCPCRYEGAVTVETMPAWLRASHVAAGNSGVYPHNGASRYVVSRACAAELTEADPDWTSVVQDVADEAAIVATFRARAGLCRICGEEPTAVGMDPPGRCVRCARLTRECC